MSYAKNKTFKILVATILILSFSAILGTGKAYAAFGDCISWIWGGNNGSTTYSTPYAPSPDETPTNSLSDASPTVLGQANSSATPVYASPPPLYTDVCPNEYSTMKPTAQTVVPTAQPATELRPVVKKEWSYSPIKSVNYKPVQQVDPQTGQVSTYYREEESKTLLPWLHQKETIEYKPVLIPPKPISNPQIVQANYASSQTVLPTAQVSYASVPTYDPCNPCGTIILQDGVTGSDVLRISEPIPYNTTGNLILNQSPNASSISSTYVSKNNGGNGKERIVNYGIPPVRDGYEQARSQAYSESTPASAADQIPMLPVGRSDSVRKPDIMEGTRENETNITTSAMISEADLRPVHPFTEVVQKPLSEETVTKSANLIKTPAPDLPILKSTQTKEKINAPKPLTPNQKTISPTQVHLKYRPLMEK